MTNILNTAHFCSGGGTTFQHVADRANGGELGDIRSRVMIASKDDIGALKKAQELGIDIELLKNPKDAEEIIALLKKYNIDHVFLNGYLPKYPIDAIEYIISEKGGNSYNQHPGPLRKNGIDFGGDGELGMYGSRVTAARVLYLLAVGAQGEDVFTESTTQYVSPTVDKGQVIGIKSLDFRRALEGFKGAWNEEIGGVLDETILSQLDFTNMESHGVIALDSFINDIQGRLLGLEHENVAETMLKLGIDEKLKIASEYRQVLVPDENKGILNTSKQRAVKMYPKG